MTQDRRTFLRHAVGLGGVSAFGGLAGCVGDGPDLVDGGGGNGGGGNGGGGNGGGGNGGDEPSGDSLDLRAGMEIGTTFTALGGQTFRSEVDPDEPGGGRLITVDDVDAGEAVTVSWRETVERERTPTETADVGVGEPTPTPIVEIVERTGTVTASGLDTAHESLLPMYWETGETTTDTSAMWLSREAFQELTDTRQTAWSADVLTRISWVGPEAMERIHSGVETVDEVTLEAEADFVEFELTVDGQSATVQAIRAHDSFGNEYVVLANEKNPLVVKFTYNAISVGVTGFDTALWTLIKAVFSGYQVVSIETP